ncbi:MAG: ABC transporter ATP-binding protein [Gemmatimonadales bacterium]|nr:ABC transporter ATP-binding protein [Gemmatimonadales bacterium]MDQ3427820.1 ABC transporter ATP-binding protein/permease [Gemmatimonadota bacterium]
MPPTALSLAARSLQFVRPFRRSLASVLVLALVLASLSALDPLIMKYLFDQLGTPGGLDNFALAMAGLLALEMVRAALQAWMGVRSWEIRLGVDFEVRERIVSKLNALPIAFHQREGVGGTMNRINQGISGYIAAFSDIAFNLLPTLLYLCLSIAAMLQLEWRLAALVMLFTPLPALIGARAAPEQMQRERRLVERWSSIYSRFNEVLAGMMTVKGFGMEDVEKRRFLDGVRETNEVVRRGVWKDGRSGAFRGLAATLARLLALALGGYFASRGEITVGTLVAFLGYIGGLFGPVQGLTNAYQTLRKVSVSLESIFGILDADDVVGDAPGAADVRQLRGEVQFREVTFGYQPGEPVLRGINLTVHPGETVALIGPSGSGKSTLVTLLQRLYAATGGEITVDGIDIHAMTQHSLRSQIGVVFQDPHLFNDTVRANIAYGRPAASQEEIEAAARAAQAHEFILALPEQYDTIVQERGSRLSGGQRQRIAIARALLKNPPILILDEATSALDGDSERLIQVALSRLLENRTALVIAHRLSTVRDADRIVVIQNGQISEMGTHFELLLRGGYYAGLVERQERGFLTESNGPPRRVAPNRLTSPPRMR